MWFIYFQHIFKAPHLSKSAGSDEELYSLFKNPTTIYRPFVRWWWNGDKAV
jgi:hypothetical protein